MADRAAVGAEAMAPFLPLRSIHNRGDSSFT